jgi:geranylgeranyl reductase family protein
VPIAARNLDSVLTADVAIVGGGPAGAAAAITLARSGRDVVVVDKARFPRDKCCGDGLTAEALRLLDALGLDPDAVASWETVDDVVVRSPSGRIAAFPLPRGQGVFAAVARRVDLDSALLDIARAAGAKVLDGHALRDARQHDDRVVIAVEGIGELHGHYAVGADGMWSPLRKAIGAATPGYLGEWHAFRQYFAGVGPQARQLWVWFEPDLLPGYAWSFPLPDGRANVGFGIQRSDLDRSGRIRRVQEMKEAWPELLARPHIASVLGANARPEAPHRAWPIPARVDSTTLTSGRVLFVGDAACATDPLTGEGIAQALATGVLAARAIAAAGPFDPTSAAATYEASVRNALFADHRMSRVLVHAVRHGRGARAGLRLASLTPWTARSFGRWLFEGYPRALLATPGRWHRGMFTEPGAFAAPTREKREGAAPRGAEVRAST